MEKFFTGISRVNSVLFLLILLAIAGTLAVWNWPTGERPYPRTIGAGTAEADADAGLPLVFDRARQICGTDTLLIPLATERTYEAFGSGTDYERDAHNIFIARGSSGVSGWLLPSNANLILTWDQLTWNDRCKPGDPTPTLYLEIVEADSNGDQRLDRADKRVVALARADWMAPRIILRNVSNVIAHESVDEHTIVIVYRTGDAVRHARFRADTFDQLSDQAIPDLPALP